MDKASRALLTHTRLWYLIDGRAQRPGRLATMLSSVLQGKYKPIFHRSQDCGDHVVVLNTKHVDFSGNKWDNKLYRHHTGFPGGFTEVKAKDVHERKPKEVLRKAVWGMLPRNKLRHAWMKRLHLFEGEEHPYAENIYATLKGTRSDDAAFSMAPYILRPPGEYAALEDMIEQQGLEPETVVHIPFSDDR